MANVNNPLGRDSGNSVVDGSDIKTKKPAEKISQRAAGGRLKRSISERSHGHPEPVREDG
jgi:hypothetical protein